MTATIVTFTVIRVAPTAFAEQAPYLIAIVEDSNGERSCVRVAGFRDGSEVRIGQTVVALTAADSDGALYKIQEN